MVAINLPRSRDDWTLGFRRDAAQEHQPDDRRWDGVPHIPDTGPSVRPGAEPADLVRRPRALPDRGRGCAVAGWRRSWPPSCWCSS